MTDITVVRRRGRLGTRLMRGATVVLPLLGFTSTADGQRVGAATATVPATPAPLPPGTPLGGPGRQTLGGQGAVRVEERSALPAAPTPPPIAPSPFRAVADEIDRSAGPF